MPQVLSKAAKGGNGRLFLQDEHPEPTKGDRYKRGDSVIHFDHAENLYGRWPSPVCIVSDGPYGISGFPGDDHQHHTLAESYSPHIEAWSKKATGQTTLWFWNTEVGWATVHPVLVANGWEYRSCNVWDKGMGHIAGNCNTQTIRRFPVVTEVCVHYTKSVTFTVDGREVTMQDWLRHEWKRTGLPMNLTNEACGVKNAATRKYFTADHLWYFPPIDAFEKIAAYANKYGDPDGRPYFSRDGKKPISAVEWATYRAKFSCETGVTNVWNAPQVSGAERIQGERKGQRYKFTSLHGSQKPLKFIDLTIRTSTDQDDVVWEPFGGLCPVAVCSLALKRRSYSAEIISEFYSAAVDRLSRCRVP